MISTEKSDTRASGEATPKRIQTDMLNAEQVGQFQLHLINTDQFFVSKSIMMVAHFADQQRQDNESLKWLFIANRLDCVS